MGTARQRCKPPIITSYTSPIPFEAIPGSLSILPIAGDINSPCLLLSSGPLPPAPPSESSPPSLNMPNQPAQPSSATKSPSPIYPVSVIAFSPPLPSQPPLTLQLKHIAKKKPRPDDYGALEPAISGKIMELHHGAHHKTYVNSYNAAAEKLAAASGSPAAQIALQPLINFHGGGHINHSLFWENLAPRSAGGGDPPGGKLAESIEDAFGGVEKLQKLFGEKLAGIQGSGWAWLVKDKETGGIGVKTYAVSFCLFLRCGFGKSRWCVLRRKD